MIEKDKQTISKLEIIKEMAPEKSVQQLAQVQIEYIKQNSKGKIRFKKEDEY